MAVPAVNTPVRGSGHSASALKNWRKNRPKNPAYRVMSSKIVKPSEAATYERARNLTNLGVWTVKVQQRRLQSSEPEDEDFALRKWSDFHFLVVALTRLRRAAELAEKVPALKSKIGDALKKFDAALPNLKKMRDVAEHIDDYALDRGKDKNVSRKSLGVASYDGGTWKWLGYEMEEKKALDASVQLFEAVRQSQSLLKNEPNTADEGGCNSCA